MSLSQSDALEAIQRQLDGERWTPDTCAAIADILRSVGYEVRDVAEDVPAEDTPSSRRLALIAEHVRLIGYDPFMDEPSISEETVAQTLRDWKLEALTAEYTAWREANGFAKECALELLNSGRANDTQSAWLTLFNARWDEAAQ